MAPEFETYITETHAAGGSTNTYSAARIAKLLISDEEYSEYEDMSEIVQSALTDLRHLCDALGLSLGDLDGGAHQDYLRERNDPIATFEVQP